MLGNGLRVDLGGAVLNLCASPVPGTPLSAPMIWPPSRTLENAAEFTLHALAPAALLPSNVFLPLRCLLATTHAPRSSSSATSSMKQNYDGFYHISLYIYIATANVYLALPCVRLRSYINSPKRCFY